MNKVRMGFIGCGGIANGKHLPAQKRNPAAEMVAFATLSRNARKRLARSTASPAQKYTRITRSF